MNNHLFALREYMKQQGLDALIVPTNDPHFSEYVSPRFKCREWLTGFTGSAGTAVVTQADAALFTDSRYFLQAEQQLQDSGFELKKEGLPESESIAAYLKSRLGKGSVGVDGKLYAVAGFSALEAELEPLSLAAVSDPFEKVWGDRPPLPDTEAFLMDDALAGATIAEKLQALRAKLKPEANSIYIASALDEVAWLLNLRGGDVAYTPVNIAYAAVELDTDSVHLFINPQKLKAGDAARLKEQRVSIHAYGDFEPQLERIAAAKNVIFNGHRTNVSTQKAVQRSGSKLTPEGGAFGAISLLKAVKNEAEVAGIRRAMIADGVAWVRFWRWLEENVDSGSLTEIGAGEQLRRLRAQCPDFLEESFSPIVGYREHGAIVHYSATPESSIALGRDTFILIDTGGQYRCGTTDITRTLHLGAPSEQEKTDYTLVLKGHLQLSAAKFPYGTRGAQLDMLARQPLMQHHLTYLHGTGHGVGHCLCVHEGPQSIRLNENPAMLEPNMLTSCEPGVYRANRYGIRIENLVLTVPSGESEFGKFLQLEPVTLCPIDLKALNVALLNPCDVEYLNRYHGKVYQLLSPLLEGDDKEFLKKKTEKITTL
ncbi:MAG: aminopeptidase P family protein [Prevotellaceae bacterium]|jgi:Xaa-Pro aminopeptidase|nr:aminopeptidase P family protein [Prevotellaceae bacterium]